MDSMAEVYADSLHEHFKVLYANWPPAYTPQLGDYGVMKDNIFLRSANVKERFGIDFQVREGKAEDMDFKSSDSVDVVFNAKGSGTVSGGPTIKASMDITFSKKQSVFFYAADCRSKSIENKAALGDELLKLFEKKMWNEHFVVLTDLIDAGATTVVISGGDNSSISIEASSDAVPTINLANAGLDLSVKRESNVGYKVVAGKGLVPLIGFCAVETYIFGIKEPSFEPYKLSRVLPLAKLNLDEKKRKEAKQSLYFHQLR